MKKILLAVSLLGMSGVATAIPTSFNYYADSNGGVTSATTTFAYGADNSILDITIDNTSGSLLNDGSLGNAPVITGLGMNLTPDALTLADWSLVDSDGNDISSFWSVDFNSGTGNLSFDWYASTSPGSTAKGGIYNSEYDGSALDITSYLSADAMPDLATLTLDFSSDISSVDTAFLRVQNVGTDGEGSLKLTGDPGCQAPCGGGFEEIPEPQSLALLGLGLIGMYAARRRVGADK